MKKNEELTKIVHYITLHPHMDLNEGCELILNWVDKQLMQADTAKKPSVSPVAKESIQYPSTSGAKKVAEEVVPIVTADVKSSEAVEVISEKKEVEESVTPVAPDVLPDKAEVEQIEETVVEKTVPKSKTSGKKSQ